MNISKREKIGLIIFISILLCIVSYNFFSNKKSNIEVLSKENKSKQIPDTKLNSEEKSKKIEVYICGEIAKPDVYTMKEGDRIVSLIKMAGGFTLNANQGAVNLSQKLKDEDQIIIPSKQDASIQATGQNNSSASSVSNGKININTADKSQLESLPRIGEALAQRIIDYRNSNGHFKKIEDITNVSGIGSKTFEGFKEQITVNW